MNLREDQKTQASYDSEHWTHKPGRETICHSERHIGNLMGKIATVAEMYDHGETPNLRTLDSETIPDLLIFAALLANDIGIDLGKAFIARTESLRQRFFRVIFSLYAELISILILFDSFFPNLKPGIYSFKKALDSIIFMTLSRPCILAPTDNEKIDIVLRLIYNSHSY